MSKKIEIGAKPTGRSAPPTVDQWVDNRAAEVEADPVKAEPIKRLTIDLPESLHRRLKAHCANNGTTMVNEIRDVLLQKYGKP